MTPLHGSAAERSDRLDEPQRLASWYTPGLSDGVGDRLLMFDNGTASSLELLRFRPEFGRSPEFEEALRRRVYDLAPFSHPSVAKVRAVEWLGEEDGLALISNHTVGRRLSEILHDARGPQFATELVRQLVPAVAALQDQGTGVAHGLLTPERVIVTPEGRLVLVEHVLGAAVDALRLSPGALQSVLGIAAPPGGHVTRLDARTDVVQIGYMALSLLVGERVRSAVSSGEIFGLLDRQAFGAGASTPAPAYLQRWLLRALQVDGQPFGSAGDAERALADWPERELARESKARFEKHLEPAPGGPIPVRPEPRHAPPPIHVAPRPYAVPTSSSPVEPTTRPAASVPAAEQMRARPAMAVERPRVVQRTAEVPPPAVLSIGSEPDFPAESTDDAPAPARRRRPSWIVVGLSVFSLVEAAVIAGLVLTRPASGEPGAPPAGGAAQAAAADAVGPAATSDHGRLEITSEPAGARVSVDGSPAGTTPLSLALASGEHAVVITNGAATTRRTVNVAAGATATLVASLAPSGAAGGWVSMASPLDLQVHEGDSLLGTTQAERIMLPTGRHQLRLSSAALDYETTVIVDIQAGRTVTTTIAVPDGSLSLNALPWANVWLDGQSIGMTPLANLGVPIGVHEVIWRHPQLGERRQTVVVTTQAPVRLVMDLRK